MTKRIILSVLLVAVFLFFTTLFYRTVCLMLLFLVWKKPLRELLPEKYRRWAVRGVWCLLFVVLWISMPRWRIDSGDRVRLIYFDKEGNAIHPPISHYLLSTFFPEEEVVNLGITGIRFASPLIQKMHIGESLINQAKNDIADGKISNFFSPYRNLGLDNPVSAVYSQAFNQYFGTDYHAFYVCSPKHFDSSVPYPLVVFCHGYMGNWQLYQGVFNDLDNAVVASIGTNNLSGIFKADDIHSIFTFYIPMLEHMGYKIDRNRVHLIGLSNGGSAINTAMNSSHVKDFRSLTIISCHLTNLKKVPCRVNLIGGGKDGMAQGMPSQCRRLQSLGVDADIFFEKDDNHYVLVNQRKAIINFLNNRLELSPSH